MNVIHLLVEWIVPLDDFVGRDAAQVSSYPVTDLQIGTEPEQQSILDAVPVATVLVDPGEQRIVYSNRAADALFEYDSGALSGVPLSICLPSWDEDVAGVPTTVPDVLMSGGNGVISSPRASSVLVGRTWLWKRTCGPGRVKICV